MTVRALRLIGDPVLRSPCRPVTSFDDALARLVDDLFDTVALPGRAGLAAPQIGVDLAVFVYDLEGWRGHMINPSVVSNDGELDGPEGCLSVPNVRVAVPRAASVTVSGQDRHGAAIEVTGHGELARCLQHETDHVAGKLYLDTLADGRRREALRQLRDAALIDRV